MDLNKIKIILIASAVFILLFLLCYILNLIKISKKKWLNLITNSFINFGFLAVAYLLLKHFNIVNLNAFVSLAVPAFILAFIMAIVTKNTREEAGQTGYQFRLYHDSGAVIFRNPFNGFLVYGGAEAGKTVSIGKPLLREYI